MLRKYCWKKALVTVGSAAVAKLLTISRHTKPRISYGLKYAVIIGDVQLKPISAMSRIVCLIAQITLSMNNLKLFGGSVNKAIEICVNVSIVAKLIRYYQGSSSG